MLKFNLGYNSGAAPGLSFTLASVVVFLALGTGAFVFRRTERTVIDIL